MSVGNFCSNALTNFTVIHRQIVCTHKSDSQDILNIFQSWEKCHKHLSSNKHFSLDFFPYKLLTLSTNLHMLFLPTKK